MEAPAPRTQAAPPRQAPAATPARANDAAPANDRTSVVLERAERYLAMSQYDKAIATAESVIELDPGNRAARALLEKAKARQMEALRNGSSIE